MRFWKTSVCNCVCVNSSRKHFKHFESPSSRFCPTPLTTRTFILSIFHYWASIWNFNQYFLFLQWLLCLITISLDPEASPLLHWFLVLFQVLHIRSESTSYSKQPESSKRNWYNLFLSIMLQIISSNPNLTVLSVYWILV